MGEYLDTLWARDLAVPIEEPAPQIIYRDAPREQLAPCVEAEPFNAWCQALCTDLQASPTQALIRKKKCLLQEKYWGWYTHLERVHRSHTDEYSYCLFHVYRDWFQKLQLAEIALEPADEYFLDIEQRNMLADTRAKQETHEASRDLILGEDV